MRTHTLLPTHSLHMQIHIHIQHRVLLHCWNNGEFSIIPNPIPCFLNADRNVVLLFDCIVPVVCVFVLGFHFSSNVKIVKISW